MHTPVGVFDIDQRRVHVDLTPLEGQPQALTARRVEPAPERQHPRPQQQPQAAGRACRCAPDAVQRVLQLGEHRGGAHQHQQHAQGRGQHTAGRAVDTFQQRLHGLPPAASLARLALEVEKQVLAPQITVRVDYAAAAQMGVPAPQVLAALQTLVEGEKVAQVVEGSRRFALVVRLPDSARSIDGLARVLIDTPRGPVPLSRLATIEEGDGPNQISRDDGKRRIVLSANAQGRALSDVVADIRQAVGDTRLPEGYFITLGGQFQAQEEASRLVGLLAIVSLVLMFVVLYTRYRSATLSALIMANIPLALVGAVLGLWVSGQPLSVAALIGFITLAGISVRNGILKVSHYLNLMRVEGERFDTAMIVRGSLERLSPVLMTALVTAFALAPLLLEAERPGTEILHPVAVVIFSGLISSTLLDTFLTPALFWLFGRKDAERLLDDKNAEAF